MKYYHILLAAALMLVAGCQEKSSPETPAPPVEVANGYFVTPDGAGERTGEDWENALSLTQLVDSLYYTVDADLSNANGEKYTGKTFYLSGGNHSIEKSFKIGYTSYKDVGDYVYLTFKGGYDPASTGKDLSKRDIAKYKTTFCPAEGYVGLAMELSNNVYLSFEGITFADFTNSTTSVISVLGADKNIGSVLSIKDCEFNNNTNTYTAAFLRRAGALFLSLSTTAKLDNVVFSGNKTGTNSETEGSAIYTAGVLFMNNCKFLENGLTGSTSGGRASVIYSLEAICMHNTFMAKSSGPAPAVHLTTRTPALIANSSFIEETLTSIGVSDAEAKRTIIVNSILLSEAENRYGLDLMNFYGQLVSGGYNLIGTIRDSGVGNYGFVASDTDRTDCTLSGLGMTWEDGNYVWNGAVEGFTRATLDEVKATMLEYQPAGDETLGQRFVEWLESINAFDTDCFGNPRNPNSLWPGAYQGAN